MPATEFTPLASTLGGILIGAAAVLLMAFNGRIAGISGILGRLLPPYRNGDVLGAASFIGAMMMAPILYVAFSGKPYGAVISTNLPLMIIAGLLVGFGASLGGGCTSGHGVCGLARLSPRSLVATCVFMSVAIVTVFMTRHVLGY